MKTKRYHVLTLVIHILNRLERNRKTDEPSYNVLIKELEKMRKEEHGHLRT